MNPAQEKIIDKIKKLLALSTSSNEHEAALAMKNANRLLMEHNLSMSDVTEVDLGNIVENEVLSPQMITPWKLTLLNTVMRLNNCQIILNSHGVYGKGGKRSVVAIGKEHNIMVSVAMYEYLLTTLKRMAKQAGLSNSRMFEDGFTHAVCEKINDIITERNKKQNEFDTQCTALVVVESAAVQKFIKEKHSNLETKNMRTSITDRQNYAKGHMAGQSVSLNDQIK